MPHQSIISWRSGHFASLACRASPTRSLPRHFVRSRTNIFRPILERQHGFAQDIRGTVLCARPWSSAAAEAKPGRLPMDSNETLILKDEVVTLLEDMAGETRALARFLQESDPEVKAEFLNMDVLSERQSYFFHVTETPFPMLTELIRERHSLDHIEVVKRPVSTGELLVLVAVNVDAGIVAGLGLAADLERSRDLAAQQLLSRLLWPRIPQAEMDWTSRRLEHCQGGTPEAGLPAKLAAEALDALSRHLQELKLNVICSFGGSWRASLSGRFQDTDLKGISREHTGMNEVVAECGEDFLRQIREVLGLALCAPHEPKEWAKTLKKPPRAITESLLVASIGGLRGEAMLEEAFGDEEGMQVRTMALRNALAQHAKRLGRTQHPLPVAVGGEADTAQTAAGSWQVQRRSFRVTKPKEDSRRPRIVNQMIVEKIRDRLNESLEKEQVVIVSGGTGSGKSTQVPQFLADDWKFGGKGSVAQAPRIVVTQPRRIAAISIAERVAWERGEEVGRTVGYSVRGSTVRPKGRGRRAGTIEFCTVGTLLRRVVGDPLLEQYNVIVLDEVHERDRMTDFLLILLRELLPRRPDLRLVLMSATLDVESFKLYFGGCPSLEVPLGTRYPVIETHLEDSFFAGFGQTKLLLQSEQEGRADAQSETSSAVSNLHQKGMRLGTADDSGRQPMSSHWWGNDTNDQTFLELMEGTIQSLIPELAADVKDTSCAMLCFLPGSRLGCNQGACQAS